MLTPDGNPAGNMDRIMLLNLWTKTLQVKRKTSKKQSSQFPIICAGMGRPTYPINAHAAEAAMLYWKKLWKTAQRARKKLKENPSFGFDRLDEIVNMHAASDYGNPQGEPEFRCKLAKALSKWYGIKINADHVLFTVGGAGALNVIFKVLDKKNPNGKIIVPQPYYSLYAAEGRKERFQLINLMQEKGYRLTARALSDSIKKSQGNISAVILCDPNNPLGTYVEEKEWLAIANILRAHPDIPVILDEAYAEMRLDGKRHVSLLQIAPDLNKRIFLMRSATKALSAAGDRMAAIVNFSAESMTQLVEANINICGHAPRSLQIAFAVAMEKLDKNELKRLKNFYKPQVEYVIQRIHQIGAALPDPNYSTNSTFYVLTDLSDLQYLELPAEATKALGKTGKIKTDEDIAYALLFGDGIMIAPLSYYGLDAKSGYMRITCSGGKNELEMLLNKIEKRLVEARLIKRKLLETGLNNILNTSTLFYGDLNSMEKNQLIAITKNFNHINKLAQNNLTALKLKQTNDELLKLVSRAKIIMDTHYKKPNVLPAMARPAYQANKTRRNSEVNLAS